MSVTPAGIAADIREPQPVNAFRPMLRRLSGNRTASRDRQSKNAQAPMLSTPSGNVTEARDVQSENE